MSTIRIRPIAPESGPEIDHVARWMRATLVEVEGEATARALHSMQWLRERVRWHLNPALSCAAVLLAENSSGQILGHTIVRRETGENGEVFGLVATTYVDPVARRTGIGQQLLQAGEHWFMAQSLRHSATWTSAKNARLISLYRKNGYHQTDSATHGITGTPMVRLAKRLSADH